MDHLPPLAALRVFDSVARHMSFTAAARELGMTQAGAGRLFTDELGRLNQRLARLCDRVVLVVAGQPVPIKTPGV